MKPSKIVKITFISFIAIIIVFAVLFPVYYMFQLSIKPSGTLATTELELIPAEVTAENYKELLIGHREGKVRAEEFTLLADEVTIDGETKITFFGATVLAKNSKEFNLMNAELLEYRAEDVREEEDRILLVGGDYAKLKASELKAKRVIGALSIEAKKVIVEGSNCDIDLSLFRETAEGNFESENVSMVIKNVKMSAQNVVVEVENFHSVLVSKVGGELLGYMKNSFILAILTVIFTLIFVIPAAYAFSRLKFFGGGHILYFYLMFTQVSGGLGIAGLVALYGMLVKLNLTDNIYILPLIYAGASVPFNTWLLKTNIDSISPDFDEAAFVDGAGYLQTIRYVILPMAMPGIATISIFAFIAGWTELILANLMLSEANQPLSVWLYVMLQNMRAVSWNEFATASLIFAVPVFLMFMIAQKYIRSGLTLGGLKE